MPERLLLDPEEGSSVEGEESGGPDGRAEDDDGAGGGCDEVDTSPSVAPPKPLKCASFPLLPPAPLPPTRENM